MVDDTEHRIGPNLALTDAWTEFRYHAEQWAVWESGSRFIAMPAGRGSGKTELSKRKLVMSLMFDPTAESSNRAVSSQVTSSTWSPHCWAKP